MSDYAWIPNYTMQHDVEYTTLISEGEQGEERRRSKRTAGIEGFSVVHNRLTTSQKNAMKAFFDAKKGANTSFTWTDPVSSVEYTVRFKNDKIVFSYNSYGRWSVQNEFKVL